MKALLIAEKPSLMRTIRDVYNRHRGEFDFEIDFVALAGHVLGLKMPDEINPSYKKWSLDHLPMEVPFRYKTLSGKAQIVSQIKSAINSGQYDFVVNSGDPDQEGQVLVREVLQHVGNRLPVKRFWSNDQTEGAVLDALLHLKDDRDYDHLAEAGFTRQHLDYVYGMNLTEGMTLKSNTLIRMGRVKAPIIRAIVDREREIEEFVPSSTYQRAFTYDDTYQFVDTSETFDTKEALSATVSRIPTQAEVIDCKQERKNVKAPKLYKLSSLQTDAYGKLGFSAAKTLSVLQTLYEQQVVSYPRSSCEYISSHTDVAGIYRGIAGMIPEIASHGLAARSAAEVCADKAYCNDRAIASEGHTGIIPTGKRPSGLNSDQQKLYALIARRFAAICMKPKQTLVTNITAKDENEYRYDCKGTKDLDASFEYILNPNYHPKQFDFAPQPHTMLNPVIFTPKEIEKKCPARYNDGSLVKFLSNPKDYKDEEGHTVKYTIGTEATRANIIEECMKNNYFTKEKGSFIPTEFAKTIIKEYGDLPVFNIDTSAQWESMLESIRTGEASAQTVEDDLTGQMREMVADIKERTVTKLAYRSNDPKSKAALAKQDAICKCPCCADGQIRENTKAFGCTNWNAENKCGFTIWKNTCGATLTKTDVRKLIEGKTITKTCHKKDGGTYQAQLAYDFDNGKVDFAKNLQQTRER